MKWMNWKKVVAIGLAASLSLGMTACGDTSYSMKLDDITVPSGVYILQKMEAINTAMSHEDYDSETTDPLTTTIEDMSFTDWVDAEALQLTKEYLYLNRTFAEKGMTLTEEEISSAASTASMMWEYYGETYESVGIAESSYAAVMEANYKSQQLFLDQYGEGGSDAVAREDLLNFWQTEYAMVQVMSFSTLDDEGTELAELEKQSVESEANTYLERAKEGEDMVALINEKTLADAEEGETPEIDEEADYITTLRLGEAGGSISEELSGEIRDNAEVGTPVLLSDSSGYYVVLRYQTNDDEEFETSYDSVLYEYKGDEFNDAVSEAAKALEPEINQNTANTFTVQKLIAQQ